jgi:hypothetical protein
MKPYSLTMFHNQYDNQTNKTMEFDSWEEFVYLLQELYKRPLAGKKDAQLISPSTYEMGTTRANRNVIDWGHWACVDVDDFTGDINDILDRFDTYNSVVYSTASSTVEQPKFRIVFDLDRRVSAEELRHFWFALNKFLGELGDPQTKDSSRMYYIPGSYKDSNHFMYRTVGNPLVVDRLLRAYPYVAPSGNTFLDKLPENMRDKVLQHRKDSMDNTDVTWSGYLDCPFFPNKMAMEYRNIAGTGWYSYLYKIMIATACNAVKNKYPITGQQIAVMCKQLDAETGGWYDNRPLEREANTAIQWAYANAWDE